jgi:hypothetical protein
MSLKIVALPSGLGAERYSANLILVRPDNFVAWTCQEEDVCTKTAELILTYSLAKSDDEIV